MRPRKSPTSFIYHGIWLAKEKQKSLHHKNRFETRVSTTSFPGSSLYLERVRVLSRGQVRKLETRLGFRRKQATAAGKRVRSQASLAEAGFVLHLKVGLIQTWTINYWRRLSPHWNVAARAACKRSRLFLNRGKNLPPTHHFVRLPTSSPPDDGTYQKVQYSHNQAIKNGLKKALISTDFLSFKYPRLNSVWKWFEFLTPTSNNTQF